MSKVAKAEWEGVHSQSGLSDRDVIAAMQNPVPNIVNNQEHTRGMPHVCALKFFFCND